MWKILDLTNGEYVEHVEFTGSFYRVTTSFRLKCQARKALYWVLTHNIKRYKNQFEIIEVK